jgi:hypothetical protein
MTNVTRKFLSMYIFLFLTLYMFRARGLDDLEKGRISYRYLDSNLGPSVLSPSRYPVAVLGI